MSLYIFLYSIVILSLLYVGYIFFNKYKNIVGISFFLFTIFTSIWFILYFISFFTTDNVMILLNISRFAFGFSLLAIYSLLLFIINFDKGNKKIDLKWPIKSFIYIILFLFFLTIFTPLIIKGMYFNIEKQDYYEIEGIFFNIYLFFQLLFFPLFIFSVFYKYKSLYSISKIRFKYILGGAFLFIALALFFELILPIFGIYILEKEIILFIIPFLLFSWYSSYRYYFTDISLKYKEIITFILSIFLTIIIFISVKNMFLFFPEGFNNYWGMNNKFTYIDLILGIIIYLLFYKFFIYIMPGNSQYSNINNIINKWKEMVPFITNIYDLNIFLSKEIKNKFNINYSNLKLVNKNNTNLYNFFIKNINNDIFINDIVFLEENKNKFNIEEISNELNKKVFIIFPLKDNKGKIIGVFELGNKLFNEQYYSEEIDIIKDFVRFLVGHLKYIEIYSKINDLNINLDKKVDEKTIEFNTLISKQREFISMSSHEIKTPVLSASLQVENLLDDINCDIINNKNLIKEITILKDQIFKISDLVKNIFSVQKHEIKDVGLYLEKVRLNDIIIGEYDILRRIYPNINFELNLDKNIGFIDIDKIQFTQVISNLINNAIKFVNGSKSIINIKSKKDNENIKIIIEDNGIGFSNGDENIIFEKYSTGYGKSVGIGMGLYLCKKIIELHGGKIKARKSKLLGGARFDILLPIKILNK